MSLSASPGLDHPTLPEGQLLYAVGDIHGRLDLLQNLLDLIEADARASGQAERRTLVFLGDYVDRGPDSRGVVETADRDLPARLRHAFPQGQSRGDPARLPRRCVGVSIIGCMNGGDATMLSYGVDTERLARLGAPAETWRKAFAEALPEAHLRFFQSLQLSVAFGDYLFVHAGVRPGVPLAAQSEADLIWIRGPFLDHAEPFGKIVVHGHTPGTRAGDAAKPHRHRYRCRVSPAG